MKKNQHEESEYSRERSVNLLLDLYPPSNGIRMPGVSQRAPRILIRRARTATEARHANYFSVCTILRRITSSQLGDALATQAVYHN